MIPLTRVCAAAMTALGVGTSIAASNEPPSNDFVVRAAGGAVGWSESPEQRDARMAWWRDAKFGIFIHWGLYSRLEGKWDGKEVEGVGEWILENGKIPCSGYVREAKKFDPKSYDPQAWAKLIADAGAKYVVITSRHHDGYCLWDSKARVPGLMDDGGPKRDLLGPLKKAAEANGLKFGLYYSIMDWTHPDWEARRAWNDLWPSRPPQAEKFERYIDDQLKELASAYQPAVVWFDGEWEDAWSRGEGERTQRLTRELFPQAIVNDRCVKGRPGMRRQGDRAAAPTEDVGDYGTPEQEVPRRVLADVDWETCMTMNDTWGYKASDVNFKSSGECIRTLIDVVSKGGNFLLNLGPDGDGNIPGTSARRLEDMGKWLAVNGEAIYATRAGPLVKLPYGRSTQRTGVIYLHVFDWPADGTLLVPGLRSEVTGARILGAADAKVSVAPVADGVSLAVPREPVHADATVIAISIKGPPRVDAAPLEAVPPGTIELRADGATLSGGRLALERRDGDRPNIGFWTDAKAAAAWPTVAIRQPGLYDVSLMLSCESGAAGNDFVVEIGDQQLRGTTKSTGSWEDFERVSLGRVKLDAGTMAVKVRAEGSVRYALMNLQDLRLTPVKGTK